MPSPHAFSVGALYRREDVADRIGLGLRERGGNWLTGYTRVGGEFFVFANVGVAGRTGHDYANRWDGKRLIWFGKTATTRSQREVTDLLSGTFPVHVFWRARD